MCKKKKKAIEVKGEPSLRILGVGRRPNQQNRRGDTRMK